MSLSTVNPKGQGVVHNNPMIWYVITALIGNALKRETTFLVELRGTTTTTGDEHRLLLIHSMFLVGRHFSALRPCLTFDNHTHLSSSSHIGDGRMGGIRDCERRRGIKLCVETAHDLELRFA